MPASRPVVPDVINLGRGARTTRSDDLTSEAISLQHEWTIPCILRILGLLPTFSRPTHRGSNPCPLPAGPESILASPSTAVLACQGSSERTRTTSSRPYSASTFVPSSSSGILRSVMCWCAACLHCAFSRRRRLPLCFRGVQQLHVGHSAIRPIILMNHSPSTDWCFASLNQNPLPIPSTP